MAAGIVAGAVGMVVRIGWHDVRIGAIGTAFLFTVGKFLIGWYLGSSSVAPSFGATGTTVVIILLWVYYSSWIGAAT